MGLTRYAQPNPFDGVFLTNGEETVPRPLILSLIAMTSGVLRLGFRRASKTETVTQMRALTGTTPAAATPTLVRMGLYLVDANGNLTLVASTPNDTGLLAVASTAYSKALSSSYVKQRGQWYALGLLVVTSVTAPTLYGNFPGIATEDQLAPRLNGAVAGQTDLPASIAAGSVGATNSTPYLVVAP